MPTFRATLLLIFSAPLLALATWLPAFAWLAAVWALVALVAIAMDWWRARPQHAFELGRLHENRLSLGIDNTIRLTLRNTTTRPLRFWVRDEPPDAWVTQAVVVEGSAAGRETWEGRYTVYPKRRGDYQFGNMVVRWLGPLGLWMRQQTFDQSAEVRVYPNLLDVRRYDLLLRRNRLRDVGLRDSRQFGEGTEYDRLREYLPDDDFRRIDWKATARRSKPITVDYQVERSQNILAVIDTGRMMQSHIGDIAKLDYVINASLLLSYVASGMGDKMGLMTFADDVQQFIAPKQGRAQFYTMLEMLYAVEAQPVEPNFGRVLAHLSRRQRKRALIVIFTDLSGGTSMDQLVATVSLLSRRSLPLVVTISEPAIVEASQQVPADAASAYERTAAAAMLDDRRIALDSLKRRGVQTLDVPANKLSLAVIQRYLDIKNKNQL